MSTQIIGETNDILQKSISQEPRHLNPSIPEDFQEQFLEGMILAGGINHRMQNSFKGNLSMFPQSTDTFLTHTVDMLRPHVSVIYLSYGRDIYKKLPGCHILQDLYPGCGPLGGLHTGLSVCSSDWLAVAACDMPCLSWELYMFLAEAGSKTCTKHAAIIPTLEGHPHPLAALYHKKAVPVFEDCLRRHLCSVRRALEQLPVLYIKVDDQPQLIAMLKNINTPEDYAAFLITKNT